MAFAGHLGAEISLRDVPYTSRRSSAGRRNDYILFSESNTRFIVEVSAHNCAAFERYMKGFRAAAIGRVLDHKDFVVYGLDGKVVVRSHINEMKEAWQSPLRW
jgi:phosphoribosylformylglycinamidine synthase